MIRASLKKLFRFILYVLKHCLGCNNMELISFTDLHMKVIS